LEGTHVTVLRDEVAVACGDLQSGTVVDGTVGQGGHAEAILAVTPPAVRLFGFDRDPQALEASSRRLAAFGERFVAVHGGYETAKAVLAAHGIAGADRVVLDLGLSTTQLESDRGFSTRAGQPLDLRFDPTEGRPASALLRETPEPVLAKALVEYGEVPAATRLARLLREEARRGRMETTDDLVRACRSVLGPKVRTMPSALLPLQALRILVNGELARLDAFLAGIPDLLAPGGRIAIIAFHSGEDRRVKVAFKALAASGAFRLPHRKPLSPGQEEQRRNRRSRAAHLRELERVPEGMA
jgi:16S rRNA (cytosine1402-N4)-methyltransferase